MANARTVKARAWLLYPLVAFIALMGLALGAGGAYLATLGGSPYYVVTGLALLAVAVLAARRDRRAVRLYALILIGTTGWALWEAGLNGWALVPRLLVPFVLGLVLFLVMRARTPAALPWNFKGFAGGVVIAALAGFAIHQLTVTPQLDPMFRTGPALANASFPATGGTVAAGQKAGDWANYGNDPAGTRFSPLDQLNPANVSKLQVAWTYHVGPAPSGAITALEATPHKVGDRVYVSTGNSDVIALDAESGRQLWRFRPSTDMTGISIGACRGVAHYSVPNASGPCADRIITATVDARLIALDSATGKLCEGFGDHGQASLLGGMGIVMKGYYYVTSTPTIIKGKIVLGGWVSDGQYWGEPSGVIRAFDAVTGKFAWAFDMGRPDDHSEPAPGKGYTHSTPNSWAPMSADEELGLVYVPTGNATPDYYGGRRRPFDDKYSSAVLALDAATGAIRWSFQTTHHDLWDYDTASQPTLVDLPTANGVQRALIQPTKRGEVFLLDRTNGRPLAAVSERKVPTSGTVPGERVSPTQPFSEGMPSFAGPDLNEKSMWGVSPLDQLFCRVMFKSARYEGTMTPPGLTPNISFPGFLGGMNWGGVSIDRARNLMIVNSNRVPIRAQLITRAEANAAGIDIRIKKVRGHQGGGQPQANTPYAAVVMPLMTPLLMPCNTPPYGLITAVDLKTRRVVWSKPLGTAADSGPLGIKTMLPIPIGLPNIGGSVATRSGLTFIAASQQPVIRALETTTGKELWSARLPSGGHATPATYWSTRSNRQFVVIAAGGSIPLLSKIGDSIVAYALPK